MQSIIFPVKYDVDVVPMIGVRRPAYRPLARYSSGECLPDDDTVSPGRRIP